MKIEKEEAIAGVTGTTLTVGGIGLAATGSSAAAMTGTLATVGSIVGGGMAAGIILTAAAPLAVGGAIFGLVKCVKHIRKTK